MTGAATAGARSPIAAVLVHVPDPDAALAWYLAAFPAGRHVDMPAQGVRCIDLGGCRIELVSADEKVGCGPAGTVVYWHAPAFDVTLVHLLARGATLYRGPMDIEDGLRMCQLQDPWGNCIGLRGR